jgi:hypothetical protein
MSRMSSTWRRLLRLCGRSPIMGRPTLRLELATTSDCISMQPSAWAGRAAFNATTASPRSFSASSRCELDQVGTRRSGTEAGPTTSNPCNFARDGELSRSRPWRGAGDSTAAVRPFRELAQPAIFNCSAFNRTRSPPTRVALPRQFSPSPEPRLPLTPPPLLPKVPPPSTPPRVADPPMHRRPHRTQRAIDDEQSGPTRRDGAVCTCRPARRSAILGLLG